MGPPLNSKTEISKPSKAIMDNISENSENGFEQENSAEDVASGLDDSVPDIIHSIALQYSFSIAVNVTIFVLVMHFVGTFLDEGLQLPVVSDLLLAPMLGLFVGFGVYIGYVSGVKDGDKFGVVAEAWRKKVEELEQYQQTEEFQQKIAEAEREVREEFKKSEWWFATKIWVGFGTLMLILIFTIVIFQ